MPVTERQLAAFAADHQGKRQFGTWPRSLAGPGDPRHVTHPLLAAGWKNTADSSLPQLNLVSPDQLVTVRIQPAPESFAAWWRIGTQPFSSGPYWYVTFGGLTPPEILAGLTDALIHPAPVNEPTVRQILADAGWTDAPAEDTPGLAVSPDQLVRVERMRESDGAFAHRVEASVHYPGGVVDRVWHGWLSVGTPPHLVAGLVRALVDTAPVLRGMLDQLGHYKADQEPSTATGQQVVDAHQERVTAARTAARRARKTPALSTRPPASPAPTTAYAPVRNR